MKIDMARASDLTAIQQIYETVHPQPDVQRNWHAPFLVVVARKGRRVIGYSSARLLEDGVFQLVETLVRPEYQGRGVGRKLMRARLWLGAELKAKRAVGGCDDDHAVMRHLLVSTGFRRMAGGMELLGRPNAMLYYKDLTNV